MLGLIESRVPPSGQPNDLPHHFVSLSLSRSGTLQPNCVCAEDKCSSSHCAWEHYHLSSLTSTALLTLSSHFIPPLSFTKCERASLRPSCLHLHESISIIDPMDPAAGSAAAAAAAAAANLTPSIFFDHLFEATDCRQLPAAKKQLLRTCFDCNCSVMIV